MQTWMWTLTDEQQRALKDWLGLSAEYDDYSPSVAAAAKRVRDAFGPPRPAWYIENSGYFDRIVGPGDVTIRCQGLGFHALHERIRDFLNGATAPDAERSPSLNLIRAVERVLAGHACATCRSCEKEIDAERELRQAYDAWRPR